MLGSLTISEVKSIGPVYVKRLDILGIQTVKDLIDHIPSRYIDYSKLTKASKANINDVVTLKGEVSPIKNIISKRGVRMQVASLIDDSGSIQVVWFNQPFLTKILYPGRIVSLAGKVGFFGKKKALVSPEYEIISDEDEETKHTGKIVPIYPETQGVSSKWLRGKINLVLQEVDFEKEENLNQEIRSKYDLIDLKKAYFDIHFPKKTSDIETARKRLAFDELLGLQLLSAARKLEWTSEKSAHKFLKSEKLKKDFIKTLPFTLTASQKNAIDEILRDMEKPIPMNRLLQGDVGSGKTIVAAVASHIIVNNNYQVIFMAPTQILANQHYLTFKKLFEKMGVEVILVTSQSKNIKKISGKCIYVGTHALLTKKELFKKVGLVIIDEQHRFGVYQRQTITKLPSRPHVLTMTATPIPRTITLTIYGDLDVSILKETPIGRKKISTWFVTEEKRKKAYEWIKSQISDFKSQIFWVCPLIEESIIETMQEVKSVKKEYEKLKKIFPTLKLGLLHGKLKQNEKDAVLADFRSNKIDILVSTPVVEVGIDIPNATVMVIEAAERFGLAQLHQLRGRVGRGDKKSYCLLFSNFAQTKRLNAITKTYSGFELAELDLKLRGPGEIFGTAQSGFPDLKVATWSDTELIKATRELANQIAKDKKNLYNIHQ